MSRSDMLVLTGVIWILVWGCVEISQVRGSVHEYVNAQFTKFGNAYIYLAGSEGLFASAPNAGNGSGVASGHSFIKFDPSITFRRTKASADKHTGDESNTGLIEAVIFELADKDIFGISLENARERKLCCSPDVHMIDSSCTLGKVIKNRHGSDDGWPKSLEVSFNGNSPEVSMDAETIPITKTGMYTVYFVFCDPNLQGLVMDGKTIWKNPSGYLPGRLVSLPMFYGIMSLAYLILGLLWFLQYARFWKDILQLQNCITGVIALGMSEMALWYFDSLNFNITGKRPVGITAWAVTFTAVKKTVSRLLILVVSMGYGVVLPTLGGLSSKVILLGATYFLALELLDMVENVGTINDSSGSAPLFLMLPVAVLDAFFILWIFTSLSRTLEKLQTRRRLAKLELYRKFTNTLAVSVVISIAWIGYELYFKAADSFAEHWEVAWIISAFWSIFAFVLLSVICILWAPSQNSTRYAYSEEVGEEFDEEEAVALTASGVKSEGDKAALKAEKKDRKLVNTDVFSLDDDAEEDKRE